MESYAEKNSQQPSTNLTNGTKSVPDLASLHHMFTQYCVWLETQGVAIGEEHLPIDFPSPLNLSKDGTQSSTFSNPDKLFDSSFGDDGLCISTPFSLTAPTSNDPSSNIAGSDQDEAMLDLMFGDVAPNLSDGFSGFLPELRDLDNVLSTSSISDDLGENQECLNESTCCFAQASKTLKSLHIPSTACISTMGKGYFTTTSMSNAPRTAGAVLTGNREAMMAISRMLRCSCSLKTQLQLVMATICDKLVTWYHAIVHREQGLGFASSTTFPKLRGGANGSGKERVLCQPITIGDYCLDGAAEAQITGRVVLAHLKAMDFLVMALARRSKDISLKSSSPRQGGEQHSSSSKDEDELLGVVIDGLVAYLVGQLQGAREEAGRLMSK
jgi:hypothetical protein